MKTAHALSGFIAPDIATAVGRFAPGTPLGIRSGCQTLTSGGATSRHVGSLVGPISSADGGAEPSTTRCKHSVSGDHHEIFERSARRYQVRSCRKPRHLLLLAKPMPKANGRDVIQPFDLPITKGLQESIHGYRRINDEELEPILRELTQLPPLDLAYGEETE